MDTTKTILSVADLAQEYGVSRTTIYAALRTGSLKAKKLGSRTLIHSADAELWFESLQDYKEAA